MQLVDPPGGRPWALLGLCAFSLLLNVVLLTEKVLPERGAEGSGPVATAQAAPSDADPLTAATVADAGTAGTGVVVVERALEEPVAPPAEEEARPEGLKVVHGTVQRSLAHTFRDIAPAHGDALSAVYARLFVWELELHRDLQRGDEVRVAYEWDGALPDIPVAHFHSQRLGRTLRAYRFRAAGDLYPSWWDENGVEVPKRLRDEPLAHYEQVTSLVKDGRGHRGMDFKVPVGTDVTSPKAGNIVRTNWNTRFNGNCVEIRYDDGTLARFLHLSEVDVRPGERVGAGARIGASGNTGRSTAPHLHYELERAGRTLDPVEYHGAFRRTLPDADRPAFLEKVTRMDRILSSRS